MVLHLLPGQLSKLVIHGRFKAPGVDPSFDQLLADHLTLHAELPAALFIFDVSAITLLRLFLRLA